MQLVRYVLVDSKRLERRLDALLEVWSERQRGAVAQQVAIPLEGEE